MDLGKNHDFGMYMMLVIEILAEIILLIFFQRINLIVVGKLGSHKYEHYVLIH